MPLPDNHIMAAANYGSPMRSSYANFLYYRVTGTPTLVPPAFADAAATAIRTAIADDYTLVLTTASNFHGVSVQWRSGGVVWIGNDYTAMSPGSVSGDELPPSSAAVIQRRSSHSGQTGRGRIYIAGVPESLTDEGRLTTGGLAEYGSLGVALNLPLTVDGCTLQPVVFSEKDNATYDTTLWQVNSIIATQRRRRLRPVI